METDEELARRLQEEFDREAQTMEIQNQKDSILAEKISKNCHTISDSESDSDASKSSIIEIYASSSGTKEESGNKDNSKTDEDTPEKKKGVKRPVCQYGADCYRKNPVHFSEFYHPQNKTKNGHDSISESTPKRSRSDEAGSTSRSKINTERKPFAERLSLSQPYSVFLNKIFSLPQTHEGQDTLVFPDLLHPKLGTIVESAQLNFMVDLDFVMSFYKNGSAAKTPVLIMYGEMEGSAKDHQGVSCVKVNMPFAYGVHHTKMMMFLYKEGMRVVVHTANLIQDDWTEKTQGFWVSDLMPALANDKKSLLEGDSPTSFKKDLVDYLLSYKCPDLVRWTHIVKGHDFSACRAYFVASVPGYHAREAKTKFGHMKVRTILRKYSKWKANAGAQVIVQCSSIGSLGKDAKSWLEGEFGASLSGGNETTSSKVRLIYPSLSDVRNSTQGYLGGSCLPYNSNTHSKQPWLKEHLNHWRSNSHHRTGSMPHLKTFTRVSVDFTHAQYYLLTSSNLSKAAWGQLQKGSTQLFVRSYEAGVLLVPAKVINEDSFKIGSKSTKDVVSLPYDLPLSPYGSTDGPWFKNTSKSEPDKQGQTYLF